MCYSPVSIRQENGFILNVDCGKCPKCLEKKRSQWTFRLLSELENSYSSYFLTLTYDDESIPRDGSLYKRDVQLFIKRLRKAQDKIDKEKKIRYYLVGEYGGELDRPHYHAIVFNMHHQLLGNIEEYVDVNTGMLYWLTDLDRIWQKGNIFVGKVEQASIHYCTKYMLNLDKDYKDKEKPFALMSTKPYLGHHYVESKMKKYHAKQLDLGVVKIGKFKISMPKTLKNNMFRSKANITKNLANKEALKMSDEYHGNLIKKHGLDRIIKSMNDEQKNAYRKSVKRSKSKKV